MSQDLNDHITRFEKLFTEGSEIEHILSTTLTTSEYSETPPSPNEILALNKFRGWVFQLKRVLNESDSKEKFKKLVKECNIDPSHPLAIPITLRILEEFIFELKNK